MSSQSLYTNLLLKNILQPFDRYLKKVGPERAFHFLIQKSTREFIINLPKDTKKALRHDPVLLLCNHPAQAEVVILWAALPPRSDSYMIVMHDMFSILPSVDKRLIPVYIGHRVNSSSQSDWKLNLLKKYHLSPEYSQEIAHQKNIQSILRASHYLDQGALISLFPAGGSANHHDFLPGVAHLLSNLKKPTRVKIVMAHVSGTSIWDFFRIIPFIANILPKIKVNYSETYNATDYLLGEPRLVARQLQNLYEYWSAPFETTFNFQSAALYLRSIFLFLIFQG